MEFVSSDTNVWVDFQVIRQVRLPFLLPYTYIMHTDAVDDELLSPAGMRQELLDNGLVPVEITMEEFELAESYGSRFPRLSIYDRIALAIAKLRAIVLMTGDMPLRKAASAENVKVMGTLGVLDKLYQSDFIDKVEYGDCLEELQKHNGREVRLPKAEITIRLQSLEKSIS